MQNEQLIKPQNQFKLNRIHIDDDIKTYNKIRRRVNNSFKYGAVSLLRNTKTKITPIKLYPDNLPISFSNGNKTSGETNTDYFVQVISDTSTCNGSSNESFFTKVKNRYINMNVNGNSNTERNGGKDKHLTSIHNYYSNLNLTSRKNSKTAISICNTNTSNYNNVNNNNSTNNSARWIKHVHSK